MTVEYRTGDLFTQNLPALAHGVNCKGVMGKGVALEFRRRWPKMYDSYRKMCLRGESNPGRAEFRPGMVWPYWAGDGRLIYNLATQDSPGRHAKLRAISGALGGMLWHAEHHGITAVGIPQIGAGIGGLRWADVRQVVEDVASTSEVRVVVVSLP